MNYLHQQGLMHRNLTPFHLYIVTFEPIRGVIADFDDCTREQYCMDVVGVRTYWAPEVHAIAISKGQQAAPNMDLKAYDNLSDLWSLGLSMYEFLASQFLANDSHVCMAQPEARKGLSTAINAWRRNPHFESISNILLYMLQPDPESRCPAHVAHSYMVEIEKEFNSHLTTPAEKSLGKHGLDHGSENEVTASSSKGTGKEKMPHRAIAPAPLTVSREGSQASSQPTSPQSATAPPRGYPWLQHPRPERRR